MKGKITLILFFLAISFCPTKGMGQSQKGSFTQKGGTVFYETYGKGSPIIFLAGGPGGSPYSALPLIEKYKKNHQCILLHQRGTGQSVNFKYTPNNFNMEAFVEDVMSLYKRLRINKASIVGHSWGGMLAMQVAVKYPQKVKSLVLLSTTYSLGNIMEMNKNIMIKLEQADIDSIKVLYGQLQLGKGDKTKMTEQLTVINLKGMFYNKNLTKEILKEGPVNMQINSLVMGDLQQKKWEVGSSLTKLSIPTMIIQGDSDPIGLESAKNLSQFINGSHLRIVKDCGHFIWIEKPTELNLLLDEFKNKL